MCTGFLISYSFYSNCLFISSVRILKKIYIYIYVFAKGKESGTRVQLYLTRKLCLRRKLFAVKKKRENVNFLVPFLFLYFILFFFLRSRIIKIHICRFVNLVNSQASSRTDHSRGKQSNGY